MENARTKFFDTHSFVLWTLAWVFAAMAIPAMAATFLAGNTKYSQGDIQGFFSNSNNSFISQNSDYFAGMSTFESGGNTGITNGNTVGIMQMTPDNIYKYTGMTPSQFAQQPGQFQANAYSSYFNGVSNEANSPIKKLEAMQANGQTVGGQQVTNGMIVGCAQLGSPRCNKQISTGCGAGQANGADGNGTTLCKFANQADANAAKGGAKSSSNNCTQNNATGTAASGSGSDASTSTTSSGTCNQQNNQNKSNTPSNPTPAQPCMCPGLRQGTDAELMQDPDPTNQVAKQNWPHTDRSYENASDNSGSSPSPGQGTQTSPSNNGATGGGGTVADISKAQAGVANGTCVGQNCECAALVQSTSDVGRTSTWRPGEQVQGNTDIQQGTVISTFNYNNGQSYAPDGSGGVSGMSHTAIYMGQNDVGIQVIDQWNSQGYAAQRTIPWTSLRTPGESGSKFYVVSH